MFISMIAWGTAPDSVKRFLGEFISIFTKKRVDLVNVKIENNLDDSVPDLTTKGHIGNILALIFVPLFSIPTIQLPWALCALLLGGLKIL